MKNPVILVVQGNEVLRRNLRERLSSESFRIYEASTEIEALRLFQDKKPQLVIAASYLKSERNSLKIAVHIRRRNPTVPIILVTRYSSEARVIAALKAGISDYFKEPFRYEELVASIKRRLPHSSQRLAPIRNNNPDQDRNDPPMIGESRPMREIKAYLRKVAPTDSTVLITGETGTGKELAASLLHRHSSRRKEPLICINCSALPDSLVESELFGYERGAFTGAVAAKQGKFELAGGGTLFLDEIGDMSSHAQAKILRSIENKENHRLGGKQGIPLDVRVIAATNKDPERLVTEGRFRKDLYYRLNVVQVSMPPLRDRKDDIPLLIDQYIRELNDRFGRSVEGFTEEALTRLLNYDWPGNVRELKNLIEAAFINLPSRRIAFMDLPKAFRRRVKEVEGLPKSERDRLLAALYATNWNKSKAAHNLHWSRMTLYRKMAKYHIVSKSKA